MENSIDGFGNLATEAVIFEMFNNMPILEPNYEGTQYEEHEKEQKLKKKENN